MNLKFFLGFFGMSKRTILYKINNLFQEMAKMHQQQDSTKKANDLEYHEANNPFYNDSDDNSE